MLKYLFEEQVVMSEDQWWAKRILLAGYKILYTKEGEVYHLHSLTWGALFKRSFTSGYSLRGFSKFYLKGAVQTVARNFIEEAGFTYKEGGIGSLCQMLFFELARHSGFVLGLKGNLVSLETRNRWMRQNK